MIFEEFLSSKRIEKAAEDNLERRHSKQAGSGFSNPAFMDGHPRVAPDRARSPIKMPAQSPEEADALILGMYTPSARKEIGHPSGMRFGPQTFRGRAQLLLMAAQERGDLVDYLLDQRHKVGQGAMQCCGDWLCGPVHRFSAALEAIARSSLLSNVATGLVLLNMVLMCMPYKGMSDGYADALEMITDYCTAAFIVEMVLKIVGLGWGAYWTDGWNAMDGSITMLAVFEIVATNFALAENGEVPKVSFLRILRMLRVARMLRLMKSWRGLYHIVMTLGKAVPQMANLFVLMILLMVIFALLGTQAFGGIYVPASGFSQEPCPGGACPDPELQPLPYRHFDYFGPAMSTVFVLMTGEWWDATEPANEVVGPIALLYFIPVVLIGRYLIMNLFIGILLHAFSEKDDDDAEPADNGPAPAGSAPPATTAEGSTEAAATTTWTPVKSALAGANGKGRGQSPSKPPKTVVVFTRPEPSGGDGDGGGDGGDGGDDGGGGGGSGDGGSAEAEANPQWPRDFSLLLFAPRSPMRIFSRYIVTREWFDPLIICIILASSVCMALDSPLNDPDSPLEITLRQLDLVWTLLFTLELLLKSIARGFACATDSYLSSAWNQLDLGIVCVSWLVLASEVFPPLEKLRALRVLRALRPLRLVQRNLGMRLIVTSLIKALPEVADAFLVVFALQSVFAILGMQLYMGSLGACTDPSLTTEVTCTDSPPASALVPSQLASPPPPALALEAAPERMLQALTALPVPPPDDLGLARRQLKGGGGGGLGWEGGPVRWVNPGFGSFDDFGSAMRLLYIMASGDEWEAPMYAMQAAQSSGQAPIRDDYDVSGAVFAVTWMFIGSFFAINLFVGVICDSFDRIKKETDASATMTPEQQQWMTAMKAMVKQAPLPGLRPPENPVRRLLWNLVTSNTFDGLITLVIVLNICVMAGDYWGIEEDSTNIRCPRRPLPAPNRRTHSCGPRALARAVLT